MKQNNKVKKVTKTFKKISESLEAENKSRHERQPENKCRKFKGRPAKDLKQVRISLA